MYYQAVEEVKDDAGTDRSCRLSFNTEENDWMSVDKIDVKAIDFLQS
jgi:hypothetical protein